MNWLEQLLKALGINPMRLSWRLRRQREQLERWLGSLRNRARGVTYKHQLCQGCGLTLDAEQRVCPRCGQRQSGPLVQRLRRAWRLLIPADALSYSHLFIIANVAFYLAMMMRSGGTAALGRSIDPQVIIRYGAWTVPLVAQGEFWRLVTPIFLHFSVLHLIFNCLWLLQLGPLVEELYGRSRFLTIYLVSGVSGFAVSVLYRLSEWRYVQAPGAGASGVVFGLIAVALVAGYLKRSPGSDIFRAGLVRWALYGLVFSFLPGIDLAAHLGGALGGGVLGWLLADRHQARRASPRLWLAVELFCWAVILGSLALVISHPFSSPPPA